MDRLEKERFNKMYDMLTELKTICAVGAEQNKQIIDKIQTLENRQSTHEELNKNRHEQNTTRLDSLKAYQDKQTLTKKIWDKIFTGAVAAISSLITLYFTAFGK